MRGNLRSFFALAIVFVSLTSFAQVAPTSGSGDFITEAREHFKKLQKSKTGAGRLSLFKQASEYPYQEIFDYLSKTIDELTDALSEQKLDAKDLKTETQIEREFCVAMISLAKLTPPNRTHELQKKYHNLTAALGLNNSGLSQSFREVYAPTMAPLVDKFLHTPQTELLMSLSEGALVLPKQNGFQLEKAIEASSNDRVYTFQRGEHVVRAPQLTTEQIVVLLNVIPEGSFITDNFVSDEKSGIPFDVSGRDKESLEVIRILA